jgi:putative ABC transport system ATP-binding protein
MPEVAGRTLLRAERLVRSFGDGAQRRIALREISVELHAGELALLMGPSGSGKSTLLAILSGLLQPDSGHVFAEDTGSSLDIWSLSEGERERFRLRNTGFIFQGYNLFPALSAIQQLEIVLKWGQGLGGREARHQAGEMLERLGLGKQMYKKPAQLSGGEKQRVAIGRALVKNPKYLFADEPTSALDWENGQQVVELLRDAAHSRGATIFIVTHDHRMLPFVDVSYHLEDGHLERMLTVAPPTQEVNGRGESHE